ncbi:MULTISPECIES: ABC transporter ATP-binding protein [unclassified Fusibacter]|uniref:ABC transporter ATP-binding protein n=1 Tax=unclassified Fusibacter TaxID=2624464 RepID=UPI0010133C5B|nr:MULTISPECIES: ABC transporter ATP-binding protein [unclassified Fusibacter]MCK8058168.1 ABC transporter ATP-binding protein [Fusibacter sp. A2]NPE20751.1 ABC transporter ATP-binding protein [Fusibacter sp. A1]RXV62958.1 ABC transporter ATP-binding protein [Fusibacter sp. A1]
MILKTKQLKKHYSQSEHVVRALDGVDISIKKGEFVAVVGKSGSGKSTLLHMLGGLDKQTEGEVIIDNTSIKDMKPDELTVYRRRNIGFVFQSYNLIPTLNVYENVTLPLALDGVKVDEAHIETIFEMLGISDKIYSLPSHLSGGQQQRVAIARALATKPLILLADEPTGNLDSHTSQEVMGLLKLSSEKFNQTVVLITHNLEIAQMADRVVHIEDGKVV